MRLSTSLLASAVCLVLSSVEGQANTFSVTFDAGISDELAKLSAIKALSFDAGFGSISFDGNLSAGTYELSELKNFAISFSFLDGNFYTQSDISTPKSEVLVVLTGTTGKENLFFSNKNEFGSGPESGSLDLNNASGGYLTFEPPGNRGIGIGEPGANLYQEGFNLGDPNFFSIYSASQVSSVPLPSSAPMFGAALLGLAGLGYAAKRKKAAAAT